jgi:hypothetical protein
MSYAIPSRVVRQPHDVKQPPLLLGVSRAVLGAEIVARVGKCVVAQRNTEYAVRHDRFVLVTPRTWPKSDGSGAPQATSNAPWVWIPRRISPDYPRCSGLKRPRRRTIRHTMAEENRATRKALRSRGCDQRAAVSTPPRVGCTSRRRCQPVDQGTRAVGDVGSSARGDRVAPEKGCGMGGSPARFARTSRTAHRGTMLHGNQDRRT